MRKNLSYINFRFNTIMIVKMFSMEVVMSLIGKELKRLRELRGMTLEEASTDIGITRQYLSMLEKGQRKSASFEIMSKISQCYRVPLDYFLVFLEENKQIAGDKLELWFTSVHNARREIVGE
jgi:transcriptional regulator with XRE-family HTH domain